MENEEVKEKFGSMGLFLLNLNDFTTERIKEMNYDEMCHAMRILYKDAPTHILGH